MTAPSKQLIDEVISFYFDRVRNRNIMASTECGKFIQPCIEHMYAGFDDLEQGIRLKKDHLVIDARKHFKRAGIEAMEFLLFSKKELASLYIEKCIEYKVAGVEIRSSLELFVQIRSDLTDTINIMRGIKSDLTEKDGPEIDYPKYDELMSMSDNLIEKFKEIEKTFENDTRIYQEIRERQEGQKKLEKVSNVGWGFLTSIISGVILIFYNLPIGIVLILIVAIIGCLLILPELITRLQGRREKNRLKDVTKTPES